MEQNQQQIISDQYENTNRFLSAALSFGEGNSSKLCDFIADSIVDACIE
jgi:S-adenosylmethionine synthetase